MTKPITIRGTTYPSRRAAAAALGITPSAITVAEQAERLDWVGTGSRRGQRWTIRGVSYTTSVEAAKALGVTPSAVRVAKQKGRIDAVGLEGTKGRIGRPPKTYQVGEETYIGATAVAEAFGLTPRTVYRMAAEGRLDELKRRKEKSNG